MPSLKLVFLGALAGLLLAPLVPAEQVAIPVTECSDGIDNDGDGATDWPNDAGCSSPHDLSESPTPSCWDGIDNDGDGLVDFPHDPDCASPYDDTEAPVAVGSLGLCVIGYSGGYVGETYGDMVYQNIVWPGDALLHVENWIFLDGMRSGESDVDCLLYGEIP